MRLWERRRPGAPLDIAAYDAVGTFSNVTAHIFQSDFHAKTGEGVDPGAGMEVHAVDQRAINVEDYRLEHLTPQYSKTPAMTLNAAVAANTGQA